MERALRFCSCLLLGCLSACARQADTDAGDSIEDLRVTFAGCRRVRLESASAPFCEHTPDRPLRFWIKGWTGARVTASLDGGAVASRAQRRTGGWLVRLAPAPGAKTLELVAERGLKRERGSKHGRWRLRLALYRPCRVEEEVISLTRGGKLQEAEQRLTRSRDVPPRCQARAASLLARLLMRLDRPSGAVNAFRRSIALQRKDGAVSGWFNDGLALSYLLTYYNRDFVSARLELAVLQSQAALYDEGRAWLPYYRGLLAKESGNARRALELFAQAELPMQRLDMVADRFAVVTGRANTLAALGRGAEASQTLEAYVAERAASLDACARADLLNDIGWYRLLRREAAIPSSTAEVADPERPLSQALALWRTECASQSDAQNALVNLALDSLQKGRLDRTAGYLAEARRQTEKVHAHTGDWLLDIEGRLALTQRRLGAAQRAFEQLGRHALPLSDARWRAQLGLAQVLEARGREREAVVAFHQAEGLLDEQLRLVPLGEGKGSFLGDRERGARHLIDLLLRQGRARDACAVARRSRSRLLWNLQHAGRPAALGASDGVAWDEGIQAYRRLRPRMEQLRSALREAAADEQAELEEKLASLERQARQALDRAYAGAPERGAGTDRFFRPEPKQLYLLYHPVRDGWVGFAVTAAGVVFRRLGRIAQDLDAERLSTRLLAPFGKQIERAEQIVVLAYGPLRQVDFHALPWRGEPLVAHLKVAYGLDLATEQTERAPAAPAQALLVIDPHGDLRAARKNRPVLRDLLRERAGLRVRSLMQHQATRGSLLAALGGIDLLHFAGHAVYEGHEGWSSRLSLARDESLTIGDILTLARVPRRVVLTACESGRTAREAQAQTLGLGHAFLMAGAREVIAVARTIDDTLAAQFSTALYRAGFADATEALRAAQLGLRDRHPGCDWAAFRILVR